MGPFCTQFECNDKFEMPGFDPDPQQAAQEKCIKHGLTDATITDPLSCYAKLLVDKCLEYHNGFVSLAAEIVTAGGEPCPATPPSSQ